jgi:hypothetical protein
MLSSLLGILAMGAVNNSFTSNYILGQANLVFPSFTIERWHTVLVAWAVGILALSVNVFAPQALHRVARLILLWNIFTFVIVIITLLATNDHKQDASFVFQDFQNMTGFGSAMATVVGILQSLFGMCCYDAASHMTEEMTHASRDAPKAIVLSVLLGAITGFMFLLTLCFCIGDIATTAKSTTGVPVIQIFYNSTQSKVGTCILATMMTVILIVASISLVAEGSRSVYAFARDHGLPFSGVLSKVEPRKKIPLYAIFLTLTVQVGLNAIYFGTETGFNTVVSIAATGFCELKDTRNYVTLKPRDMTTNILFQTDVSYGLVLFSRLLGYFFSHHTSSFTGPYSLPLPLSLSYNGIGLLFLLFAVINFNFPSEAPITPVSMNYTCAAIGLVSLLSIVTWFTTASKRFTGPSDVRNLVVNGVDSVSTLQPIPDTKLSKGT